VNDPPQIVSTPPTEVNVSDLYLYEIIVEDSDPGQAYTMQIDPVTRPKWLVLSEKAPYTLEGYPPEGSEGTYTIKLTVIDAGGLTGTQEYQLTVMPKNQRPALGRIDALLILENQTYSFTVQMFEDQFNDPDPDDQMEFITITELPINGKLMLDGSVVSLNDTILTADLGKLVYEPNSYYTGLDYFFWNASDGEAMSLNTSIVNISINPVSDPPEILNMETEAAIFYYGEQALALTEEAEVYEYDNGLIAFASIAITGNYNNSQDSLYLPAYDGIVSNWNDTTGVLIISGIKSDAEYQDMLRAVRYVNSKRYTPDSKKRTITIVVSDGGIESVPVSRDITFEDTFVSLDVPTGFTPNGDGANDTWEIGNIDVHEDAIVRVFNRDGIRVYESIGYFKPWDGVYNGSVLKPGVYYFTIEVKKYERRFSGTITLLR
jgi:gliding motility-associated-like protein